MRLAYADPPYLGCCGLYGHVHEGPFISGCWDREVTHAELFAYLRREFPDGWALSASAPSLKVLAGMMLGDERIGAWVKPFAAFKPNVNPAYAWEPVIFVGGAERTRDEATVRDWHSENIAMRRGVKGAKPDKFGGFIESLLGARSADTIVDLFPGSGQLHGLATWERPELGAATR